MSLVMPTTAERGPLRLALWLGLRRRYVEYDPTWIAEYAAELDAGSALVLTPAGTHALTDVLRWVHSKEQAKRWPPDMLKALTAVRARVEAGGETDVTVAPEPSRFDVVEVPALW